MPSGVLAHPEVNPAGPSFREQREAADFMRQQREKRQRAGSPSRGRDDGKQKKGQKQPGLSEDHQEMQATLKLLGTSNHRAMMDLFEGSGLPPGLSDTEVTISFEMFTAVQDRLLEARRDLEKTKESLMQANQRSAEMQSRSVADRERMINLERKTDQATEYAKELRKGNAELSMQCQAKEGERRRMEEQLAKTRVELRTAVESGMEMTNELAVVKSNVARLETSLERAKRDAQEVETRHQASVDALNAKAKRAAEGGPGSPGGVASTAKVASLTSQVQRLKEQLADMSGERNLEVKVRNEESAKFEAFRAAARRRQESLERCAFEAESRRAELAQDLRELQAMLVKAQCKNQKSDEEMDAFRRLVALSKTDAFTLEDVFNELQTIRNRVSRTPLPSERRLPAASVPPELVKAGFDRKSVRWLEDADAALPEETPEEKAERKRAPGATLFDVLDSERDSAVAMCSSAVESMRLLVQLERLCEESTNLTDVLKTWRKVKPKWQEGISRFALEGLKALTHSVDQAHKAERAAHKMGEDKRHAFWLKKVDGEYKVLVPEANSAVQATVDVADEGDQSDHFAAPFLSGMRGVECATEVSRPVDSYSVDAGMWTDVDYKIPDWVERLPQVPAELQADPRQLFDNLPSRVVTLHRTITTLSAVIRKRLGLKVGATTDPVEFLEKLNERPNVTDAWQLIELDDDITKAMLAGILQSKDDALRRVLLHKKKAEMHDSERTIEVYKGRPAADRKAVSFKERSRLAHFRQTKGATEQELRNTHFDDATLFRMAEDEAREDGTADGDDGDNDGIAPFGDDDDDDDGTAEPGADTEDFFASHKDNGTAAEGPSAAASARPIMASSKRRPAPPTGGMATLRKAATAMTASKRMTKSVASSSNKPAAASTSSARPTTRAAAPPKKPSAKAPGTKAATRKRATAAVTIGGEEPLDPSGLSDRSASLGAESPGGDADDSTPSGTPTSGAVHARAEESTRSDVDIMFDEADEAPEEAEEGATDDGGDDDAAPLAQQDTLLPLDPEEPVSERPPPVSEPAVAKKTVADADTMAGCPAMMLEHRHVQTEPMSMAKPAPGILALTRDAGETSQWHVAPPAGREGGVSDGPSGRSASPGSLRSGVALPVPRRGGRPGGHRRQPQSQSPPPITTASRPSPTAESPTTLAPQFDVQVISASAAYDPPADSPGLQSSQGVTPPQQGSSIADNRRASPSVTPGRSPQHGGAHSTTGLQIGTTPPREKQSPPNQQSRRSSHAAGGGGRRKSYSRSLAISDDGAGDDMSTSQQLVSALGGGFGIVSTSATMASRQASPQASRRASVAPGAGRQSPPKWGGEPAMEASAEDGPLVVSRQATGGSPAANANATERDRRREAALQHLEQQAAAANQSAQVAAAASGSPRMPNVQSKLEEMQQRRREAQLQRAARGRGATPNRADTQAQPLPSVFGAHGPSGARGAGSGTMRAARLTTPRAMPLSAAESPATPGGFGIIGSPAGAPIAGGGPTRAKSPPRTAPTQPRPGRPHQTQFPHLPGTPVDAVRAAQPQRPRRDSSSQKKDLSALLFGGGKQPAEPPASGQPARPSTQQASPGRARGGIAAARTRAAVEDERVKRGLRESGQPPPHVRIPSKQASPARTTSHSPASARTGGQEFASFELEGIAKNRAP